jgi:hypothetical protein
VEQIHSSRTHSLDHPVNPNLKREIAKDEVRFRAYQIYLARNRQPGHELDDWLQAEQELLSRN